jgi:hypothetical protein
MIAFATETSGDKGVVKSPSASKFMLVVILVPLAGIQIKGKKPTLFVRATGCWAAVKILLTSCCPSPVGGLIISVIIRPTVKSHPLGRISYVFVKALELMPAVTDCNPAGAIVFIA